MHFFVQLFLRIFQTFLAVSQFTFLIISCLFTIFPELSSTLRSLEQEGNVIGGQQCSIASQLVQQHPDQVPHPHQQQVQVVQTSAPSAQPSSKSAAQMPSSPLTPSPSSTSSQDYDLNNLDDNQYKFPAGIQNSILKRSANDSVQVCIFLYLCFLNKSILEDHYPNSQSRENNISNLVQSTVKVFVVVLFRNEMVLDVGQSQEKSQLP